MPNATPIITIDGPGGVGKGTIGRLLAHKLHWHFLDSGALYRITAYACQQTNTLLTQAQEVAKVAQDLAISFQLHKDPSFEPDILFKGAKINGIIRTETYGNLASKIAAYPEVRQALIKLQHSFAQPPGLVADGRDMGTVIFPEAKIKFFLTASAEVRAQRRHRQLQAQGIHANIDHLLQEIKERDLRDQTRSTSPLIPAKDACIIDTSTLSIDKVMELVMHHIATLGVK
jgi:cytidylate kinase